MQLNNMIDSFNGDEHSKNELKKAYKKGNKLGFSIFFIVLIFMLPTAIKQGIHGYDWLDKLLTFFLVGFVPAILCGLFFGLFSVQFFARHIKITLPEALRPKIEIERKPQEWE